MLPRSNITMDAHLQLLEDSICASENPSDVYQDYRAYRLQRSILLRVLSLSRGIQSIKFNELSALEKITSVRKAKTYADALETLRLTSFPESDHVPEITGPQTLKFAEKVYLPFLERFEQISINSSAENFIPAKYSIQSQKKRAAEQAAILRKRIEAFKNPKSVDEIVEEQIQKLNEAVSLILNPSSNKSIMSILDPNNKYANLSECLDAFCFPKNIKTQLMNYENAQRFITKLFFYNPHKELEKCLPSLGDEIIRLVKKETPYKNSLTACLKELQNSQVKPSVKYNLLKNFNVNNPDLTIKTKIEDVRRIVTAHQKTKGFWKFWNIKRKKKTSSLIIFEKYFDSNNKPKANCP